LLPFKGGVMNGQALTPEQVTSIARLPSRDILNAQLVNIVASPLTGLVTSLSNLISGLARQLSQIAEQKDAEAPAAAAAEPEPEPEAAAEPEPEAAAPDTTSDTETDKE
jgi:large subunit ribosomal protein L10